MTSLASVRATITVAVDPGLAFEVFTAEFDQWYRRGSAALGSPPRDGCTFAFEPGVGGRLVEVDSAGETIGRADITVWQPGARLVFVDRRGTEVDVTFTAIDHGTRVVVEHRGLDRLPPGQAADIAKSGWSRLAQWFESHLSHHQGLP